MFLHITEVDKSFAEKLVLRQVTLTLAEGEILVLLGPSGCGKTTLLRIIAGLETPDNGRVQLREKDITHMPPHLRQFGFVFQDYALFPHKNVSDNVAFGLRMQKWSKAQIQARVEQLLELVGLTGFGPRSIHELSGGEQQRVALARSLAPAPRLLLLDEPLGALDRALRERLMLDLRRILKEAGTLLNRPEGITAVYVTHDQAEAFAIADKVAVMNAGRIEQLAGPQQLYVQPKTPFVARFLGMENIVDGRVRSVDPLCVDTTIGQLLLASEAVSEAVYEVGEHVSVLIRPEAARLASEGAMDENIVHGRVQNISFRGRYQIVNLQLPQSVEPVSTLKFEVDTAVKIPPIGSDITVTLNPRSIVPLESGKIA